VLAVGLHVSGVERVAEEDLARAGAMRPFGVKSIAAGSTPGEVELDDELVAAAVGVHRERPRRLRSRGRELLGEPIELAVGVKRMSMGELHLLSGSPLWPAAQPPPLAVRPAA
jgi:hypothetical protein